MVPLYSAAVVVGCVVRHRFWDLQVGLPWDRRSKEGSLLGASLLPRGVGFDAFSTLGTWHFWIFTHFHPFPPFFTPFCSSPPHPLFSRRERKYGHDEILPREHLFRFFFLSTLHLIGVLISSVEQRGAVRRLGGQVCIVFVLT